MQLKIGVLGFDVARLIPHVLHFHVNNLYLY